MKVQFTKIIFELLRFLYNNASLIISCILITVFAYAASKKLGDYDQSVLQMGKSPLLTGYQHILGWLVPAIEFVIALLLALNKSRRIGLYASLGLIVMFTTYIVIITNFADHVPCSCGGIIDKLTWNEHLLLNLGLFVLAVIGIILYPNQGERKEIRFNIEEEIIEGI